MNFLKTLKIIVGIPFFAVIGVLSPWDYSLSIGYYQSNKRPPNSNKKKKELQKRRKRNKIARKSRQQNRKNK